MEPARRRRLPASVRTQFAGAEVLDALPVGLYVVDRDLTVVAWNRQRERGPQGRPRSETLGRPLGKVLPAAGYRSARSSIQAVFDTGKVEESVVDASGRTFHVRRLPLGRPRQVSHVVSCFEDITERREQELRLIAADRLSYLDRLVRGVAQQVANPLAGIAGCAEALVSLADRSSDQAGRLEAHRFRDLIRAEIASAERLVRLLLDSAGTHAQGVARPAEAVATVLKLLERHPSFAALKVHSVVVGDLPEVAIEQDSLQQVLLALTARAAEAMPKGGRLTLRTAREGRSVAVDVSDSGAPLSPRGRASVFDAFGPGGEGARLGMAIARSLVRRVGGEIVWRPSQGGNTLRVSLPITRAQR